MTKTSPSPLHQPGEGDDTEVIVTEAVTELLGALGRGDLQAIESALVQLGVRRESDLYTQVGQMARSLHESLNEFKSSINRDNLSMHTTNIPDAADKLEGVIKMTFDAAEKVMNIVDQQCAVVTKERTMNKEMRVALENRSDLPDDLRAQMLTFLDTQTNSWNRLEETTTDILIAQEFQDLTGQALRKVVKLVTGIESQMLALISLFGFQDEFPATESAEAPKENLAQDETDELLKSFGF